MTATKNKKQTRPIAGQLVLSDLAPADSPPLSKIVATHRLPPILLGRATRQVERDVYQFYAGVAVLFDQWIAGQRTANTKAAYRDRVLALVKYLKINWPKHAPRLLAVSVTDVRQWRDEMEAAEAAPKTINARIAAVSSFYKYLQGAASHLRLPINIPNPAHSQFIPRGPADAVRPTDCLTRPKLRRLLAMPQGEHVIALRDRAILKFYYCSGSRIATGCGLDVEHLRFDDEAPYFIARLKGGKRKEKGLNHAAVSDITEYLDAAGITSGPVFRPKRPGKGKQLSARRFDRTTMYRLVMSYLERLPGAVKEVELPDGSTIKRCRYTPHVLRSTPATFLLEDGADISDVRDWLDHQHVTTTQEYDKRRRAKADSPSHQVPL